MSDLREDLRTRDPRLGRWWHQVAWWRMVACAYAVVAAVCAVEILTYTVSFWQTCFAVGYDALPCLEIQSDGFAGEFTYDGIAVAWLVAAAAAVLTAVCAWRRGSRRLVPAIPILVLVVNPIGDFLLTPWFNGFYASHDTHPATGIPMGVAVAISGVLAVIVALLPRRPW